MGTSISQSSPRKSSNWKRVFVCYESNALPDNRVMNEIWRASETSEMKIEPLSSEMKSQAIYSCYEAVKSSNNFQEALQKFNNAIIETKSNSIIAEFAKRVIPSAFQSNNPSEQWTNKFFKEVTNYIMSRDASGFVGESFRNKSVKELIEFKKSVSNKVEQVIKSEKKNFTSHNDWNSFVDNSISKLKSAR
jgi:hypothetical protein